MVNFGNLPVRHQRAINDLVRGQIGIGNGHTPSLLILCSDDRQIPNRLHHVEVGPLEGYLRVDPIAIGYPSLSELRRHGRGYTVVLSTGMAYDFKPTSADLGSGTYLVLPAEVYRAGRNGISGISKHTDLEYRTL